MHPDDQNVARFSPRARRLSQSSLEPSRAQSICGIARRSGPACCGLNAPRCIRWHVSRGKWARSICARFELRNIWITAGEIPLASWRYFPWISAEHAIARPARYRDGEREGGERKRQRGRWRRGGRKERTIEERGSVETALYRFILCAP